jgi:integrase
MELREGMASSVVIPKMLSYVLVWDDKTPGLFLRVNRNGKAFWGVRYRVAGVQRRMHLRDARTTGNLSKARKEAADVRAKARLGVDVLGELKAVAEARAKAVPLGSLVDRYLADRKVAKRRGGESLWRPRYYLEVMRHLTKDWAPLAKRAIQAVTRDDIVGVIDKINAKQGPVAADRAKTALSGLFVWCIDRGYLKATPLLHIKRRSEASARERTLSSEEIKDVWLAAADLNGDHGRIVRLLLLSGQRRWEIGSLAWSEVFETGDEPRLELPATRTKNHRPHVVPLSAEALALLPPRDPDRAMVFGRRLDSGYSGWSRSKAELDEAIAVRRRARLASGMPPWTLHDLRRTLATMLGELRIAQPHIVEAIINHVSGAKGGVAGVYNRAVYLDERRQALDAWGRWVKALVNG